VDQDETFVDDGGEDDKKMGAGAKGARRTSGTTELIGEHSSKRNSANDFQTASII
jgi:hypothetical protein